ncbi:hypothetical protein FDA94_28655 [Herbidospora galbida]|uniref:Uncharacterized protein n=1 Tax=Herbidospora galbida TaxID=2575442 RepID=A0A4V5UZX6_9ACTN|nr:hypothetical protein [Herbidospora galbida]TKK84603.1 hypothetical protein FDA94_28655 [Herbidospora galbida]
MIMHDRRHTFVYTPIRFRRLERRANGVHIRFTGDRHTCKCAYVWLYHKYSKPNTARACTRNGKYAAIAMYWSARFNWNGKNTIRYNGTSKPLWLTHV